MNRQASSTRSLLSALAVGGLVAFGAVVPVRAQEAGLDERELAAALEMTRQRNGRLQAELERSRAQVEALSEKLAETVRISEEQLARTRETERTLQAFGVDLLNQDESSLEQRLLKAVRDLDIAEQEVERFRTGIAELSESYLEFVNSTENLDPERKQRALAAIESAGEVLRPVEGGAPVEEISDARVVSLDPEIGLVVFNAGKPSGLLVGTPISILRDEEAIYSALVVDVRDSISGALLQDRLITDPDVEVAVGDAIQLLPNETNL